MFKWEKLGRVFNPVDIEDSWMHEYAQAPSVVIFDNYVRVFFSSRPKPDKGGQYISRMAYIDLNRDNLFEIINICKQPILPLGGLGTFDEFGTYPVSVIKNDNEIRAYYAGWTRCESVPFNAAIGLAASSDNGESFSKIGEGPIISYTPDEPFVMGSPKIRKFKNTWYLWYSAGREWVSNNGQPQPVYKIRMATSSDGINWTKHGKDLINNVLEENECQAGADVLYYKEKYHMFFSYRHNLNFREPNRGYKIGYASSIDLINWERDDKRAGIEVSEEGWDAESVSYAYVFELNGDILMLHQGNEIGRYGFGLAKLKSYNQ
jgi:predicted GH43/DUF377 family glycosyl hydrolase